MTTYHVFNLCVLGYLGKKDDWPDEESDKELKEISEEEILPVKKKGKPFAFFLFNHLYIRTSLTDVSVFLYYIAHCVIHINIPLASL